MMSSCRGSPSGRTKDKAFRTNQTVRRGTFCADWISPARCAGFELVGPGLVGSAMRWA